ncbi:hypothetical protein J4234_04040 [Candidatus Woesearchaeota archaeon]|nr:hypothetical protein [Candidatus Woesearchaeota archaeon]
MKQAAQYFDQNGIPYLSNAGTKLLNMLNGVKHTVPSFARIHGLDPIVLAAVTNGGIGPTSEVRAAIERHYPLRVRDIYPREHQDKFPIPDDTLDGVVIYRAAQTKKTERDTFRGPESGKVRFYTYADTAMSTTSLFRPEWIAERFVHDGVDAESAPDWAFNKGHFEHQMTYFIGPVNFHWINNGRKNVVQMDTGDTNYITPFVPHTFTTRREGQGLILAVTYGGAIATEAYQSKIQQKSLDDYIKSLKIGGSRMPEITGTLATDELGGVIVRHRKDARRSEGSTGNIDELMSNVPFQPQPRALEYKIGNDSQNFRSMKADVERWGYNIGTAPILIEWASHSSRLNPGDSFFIQKGVEHSFGGKGKILVMEIKPESSNPLEELALINRYSGRRGLERVHSENTQWF